MGRVLIGTSGWHYEHWRGPFYPSGLPKTEFLRHYAARFRTVEVNNSFYRLPSRETLARWRETTPEGFLFAVKASRFITHMKKLADPERTLSPFLDTVATLGGKLGPILFQLPPRWRFDAGRLRDFLWALPAGPRYAMELRDPSWFNEKAFLAMAERDVAFCIFELAGLFSPREVTAKFVYVRLHGPKGAYQGQYDERALGGWASAIRTWAGSGKDVFCYFDNDEAGYAAQDAWRLQGMLGNS